MEINPIIVIGVPREGEGDAEMVKTNWQRAVDSGIGCVIINDDMGNKAAKDAKKAGAYVYVPGYAGEVSGSNYETESCLLYTSPSPRDQRGPRMPSSA